jgi:hypothetical protein
MKKGEQVINPDFIEFAAWIKTEYDVEVLNIIYDFIDNREKRPRLTVIFKFHNDELKFRDGDVGNFHSDRHETIGKKN